MRRGFAVLAALAAGGAPAAGQINVENFAQVGFNFSAPGARSAAMGGAFISLADDATAAETNPAGLTTLLRPEVSIEYKGVQYTRTVPVEAGGAFDAGTEFNDQVAIPSFASLVLPLGGITLGAFRHELVNYRSRTYGAGHTFFDNGTSYFYPYTTDLAMRVENYGGAAALQMGPLSIGAAGGMSLLKMELEYLRYRAPRYQPEYLQNQVIVTQEDGQQSGWFVNAGVLLRPSERFALGAVYRLRPKFDEMRLQSLNRFDEPFSLAATPDTSFVVNVPDAIGAGIAMRPHDLLTLSFDAVWNRYSQMADTIAFTFQNTGADTLLIEDFVADDGIDYRGGAEWLVFVGNTYLALRGGASLTAPSNIYYAGNDLGTQLLWGTEPADPILSYTAGLGTALFGMLQLDVAGTFSEERAEVIASGVFRFGR